MKALTRFLAAAVLSLLATFAAAEGRAFSQAELDQALAPIALYPDNLLSQILMAATYPDQVAEAASRARVNRNLSGEEAVRAVEDASWDPSVIALAAFPEVLIMMDERRDWTARLGEMNLAQPGQVMDTVQNLRSRADSAGNLRSSEQMTVQRDARDYVIESPPDATYVPYYDPRTVYGNWWWNAYPPVYWAPWPGYAWGYGYAFGWGAPVYVGYNYYYGGFNWRHRYQHYANHHQPWYAHGNGGHYQAGARWTHNGGNRGNGGNGGNGQYAGGGNRGNWNGGNGNGGQRPAGNAPGTPRYRNETRTAGNNAGNNAGFFRPGNPAPVNGGAAANPVQRQMEARTFNAPRAVQLPATQASHARPGLRPQGAAPMPQRAVPQGGGAVQRQSNPIARSAPAPSGNSGGGNRGGGGNGGGNRGGGGSGGNGGGHGGGHGGGRN